MADEEFPEIHTGNGIDRDLAATTNDRMRKTVLELRSLGVSIKELNANIVNFSASSDSYSKKLVYLTWVLVAFTVILVFMTYVLIDDAKKQTASQNNIALNSSFFNTINTKIIDAIENNQPILTENHGQYTDAQLDNFLGSFDIIQGSYDDGLLKEQDLCDSFSYYIMVSNKNSEIKNYISSTQKSDPNFFVSLNYLAKLISESKNKDCH